MLIATIQGRAKLGYLPWCGMTTGKYDSLQLGMLCLSSCVLRQDIHVLHYNTMWGRIVYTELFTKGQKLISKPMVKYFLNYFLLVVPF